MSRITKLGRSLLRGPLLRTWVNWKTQKLAKAFGQILLSPGLAQPSAPTPVLASTLLRNLLFIYDNMWEERELIPELRRLCKVTSLNVNSLKRGTGAPADESLPFAGLETELRSLKGKSFDAILIYLNSALLGRELIDFLRANWSCPIIGLNLDDKTTFADYKIFRSQATNYRKCAAWLDSNLTNSKAIVDVYHSDGLPCLYLPTGFHYDPARMTAPEAGLRKRRLSFVGSQKPERATFVHEIENAGIQIDLFGQGWPNGRFADEGWRIYRESQLSLGIGYNLTGPQITNLKNRDFECPGAGGCYLTTFDWELAELFQIGREILCYRNVEEFVEVYCYYVRRPEKCLEIARAGQARAIREHTWANRFAAAFSDLGFALNDGL
jgi:hypothetical protein